VRTDENTDNKNMDIVLSVENVKFHSIVYLRN